MLETEIHLQSLALTMVMVSAMTFLCMAPSILRFPEEFRPSLRGWITGTALVATTDIVFFTGVDLPFLDTTLMAVAGLGVTEWLHALRLLNGRARRAFWPYAVILIGTVLSSASPSYSVTAIVTSVVFGALYLGGAWVAWNIRLAGPSVGRVMLITVFAGIGLVMLGRLVLFATAGGSGSSPGFTSVPRALMFIVASAGPFAGSLAFVLTCGEKLGHQLLHLSLTDPLTEIPNRRALLDSLERALSSGRRHSESVAVLVIDVDHFKRVNDEAGHAAGDRALIEVAALLTETVRSEDVVGRLGGEEFGVVQAGTDITAATAAAERLRDAVAAMPVTVGGRSFELTVSIGAAVTAGDAEEASQLLSRADRMLYVAKRRGRNQVATDGAA
jgi:diguanylate cyclase (GGDEF)-like protein